MSDPSIRESSSRVVQGRRRAHRKVKTGCRACKVRRYKCDEQRPRCSGCIRHSTDCLYDTRERDSQTSSRETASLLPESPTDTDRPIQILTPQTNPRASPPRDLNFEDLELLHQYITSTCVATSQSPERTIQIQTTVPRLAQTYRFLMRGILGNAAVHLSWLRPAQKAHYTLLAAKHHSVALPEFQSALQNIDQDNYLAVFMYSKGLVWCSFAWFETANTVLQRTTTDWLPTWFHLLRGSCLVADYCAPWITYGSPLLPNANDTDDFSDSLDDRRLTALTTQLLPHSESPVCGPVLLALREAFARASMRHHNTPLRDAVNFWAGKISNEFVDAVREAEPWALVVMAHFGILVFRSETRWFMRGHAVELLRLISERLPEPWQQHLQWPHEEIGY